MNSPTNSPTLDDRLIRIGPAGSPDPVALAEAFTRLSARLDLPDTVDLPRTPPRRRHVVRWSAAAAAVAAALAITVLSGTGTSPAFATWTAVPDPVTSADATQAATECARFLSHFHPVVEADFVSANVVVAERRGDWTYTLLRSEDHANATWKVVECLIPANPDLGGSSAGEFTSAPAADLSPTDVQWNGGGSQDGWRSAWGRAGADVERVTLTRADGVVIDATVSNGYFAAWWPMPTNAGPEMEDFTITWYLGDGTSAGHRDVTL